MQIMTLFSSSFVNYHPLKEVASLTDYKQKASKDF